MLRESEIVDVRVKIHWMSLMFQYICSSFLVILEAISLKNFAKIFYILSALKVCPESYSKISSEETHLKLF